MASRGAGLLSPSIPVNVHTLLYVMFFSMATPSRAIPCHAILIVRATRGTAGGASAIKTYQDTQLPFPYVHLLSFIVKLALFILALDTGGELAVAYQQNYITWMVLATFKLLIMNFFYQGLLELQVSPPRCIEHTACMWTHNRYVPGMWL